MRYFEASALVKRYVAETETPAVRQLPSVEIPCASRLSSVEVASAFSRLVREGEMTEDERAAALDDLDSDMAEMRVMELDAGTCAIAQALLARHALRAGDAIQLASAIRLSLASERDVEFVGFDSRLADAARAEGLTVLP